jgi:hypothetical protein
VERLEKSGVLKEVGERDGAPLYGAMAPKPQPPLNVVTERQAAAMDYDERRQLMAFAWMFMRADIDRAEERGVFAERVDSFLTRTPMTVDEQGWRELKAIHTEALNAALEVAARSRQRLEESGATGFDVRSMQAAFETLEEPDD